MDFTLIWQRIVNLRRGEVIRNWTANNGYLGDAFIVEKPALNYVEIDTPRAETIQHVPKKDFETVYRLWESYISGRTQRQELREVTRFSKYVISIFRHMETCGYRLRP